MAELEQLTTVLPPRLAELVREQPNFAQVGMLLSLLPAPVSPNMSLSGPMCHACGLSHTALRT